MSSTPSNDTDPTTAAHGGPAADASPSPEEQAGAINALIKPTAMAFQHADDARLAAGLVVNAGRHAWRLQSTGLEIRTKANDTDFVTQADTSCEQFITGVLTLLRPDDSIMGEEGTHVQGTSGRTWVIDPVDGTYNYATGSDYFCCALALVEGPTDNPTRLILGAVHRPSVGYTWVGGPELPTSRSLIGTKQSTPCPTISNTALSEVCLGTYMHPTFLKEEADFVEPWLQAVSHAATVRIKGSASVDLATLCDGEIGAWAQHSVADWDWLPGRALVEGAGGTTATVECRGTTFCVAGSEKAVAELVEVLGR